MNNAVYINKINVLTVGRKRPNHDFGIIDNLGGVRVCCVVNCPVDDSWKNGERRNPLRTRRCAVGLPKCVVNLKIQTACLFQNNWVNCAIDVANAVCETTILAQNK